MTQEPHPTVPEIKAARENGTTRGLLDGQREAISRVESQAYLDAYHSQMRAAGLCRCEVRDEEFHADPTPTPEPTAAALTRDQLQAYSDGLSSIVATLGHIADLLKPRVEVIHQRMQPVASPDLSREVNGLLAGLGERARRHRVEDRAVGRQVDADETPAAAAQHTLDIGPEAQAKLAAGGIVQPGPALTGIAAGVDEILSSGPAPAWAPQCAFGCDNETQSPNCALHSPTTAAAAR